MACKKDILEKGLHYYVVNIMGVIPVSIKLNWSFVKCLIECVPNQYLSVSV